MLDALEAIPLVEIAQEALWAPAGRSALDYLRGRGLSDETIAEARLGWTPRLPLKGAPEGITIPWFSDGQVTAINLRQPEGRKPKYRKVYQSSPTIYPDPEAVQPGRPVVVVEGELDALLVGQELAGFGVPVVTSGSASSGPNFEIVADLLAADHWIIAVDNDEAGERLAEKWAELSPGRTVRVRIPSKDWTDLHSGGFSRIRYHLGGVLDLQQPLQEPWSDGTGEDEPAGVLAGS
jgi:DNA primase